jgi:hypothetical protein
MYKPNGCNVTEHLFTSLHFCLYNGAVSSLGCILVALNCKTSEWWSEKNVEGSDRSLTERAENREHPQSG